MTGVAEGLVQLVLPVVQVKGKSSKIGKIRAGKYIIATPLLLLMDLK